MRSRNELKKVWSKDVGAVLVGRTIKNVRYMTDDEMSGLGWYSSAVVLELDNGILLYPSKDDEGNNAGSLFTTDDMMPTIPVI